MILNNSLGVTFQNKIMICLFGNILSVKLLVDVRKNVLSLTLLIQGFINSWSIISSFKLKNNILFVFKLLSLLGKINVK